MFSTKLFGDFDPNLEYKDRRAAYAVIISDKTVAAVKGPDKYWLPGGGSLLYETAEETIVRELKEELGRSIRLIQEIGRATQYFYAVADRCYYKMDATFFRAEFTGELSESGENDLHWVPIVVAERLFFHQCHVWAINHAIHPDR